MRHHLAGGKIFSDAALGAGGEQIFQADVGERAAGHHAVVAAARAVLVEIQRVHAVLHQIFPGRAVLLDRSPAGEMWSVVTLSPTMTSTRRLVDRLNRGRASASRFGEERRLLDVGALLVEREQLAAFDGNLVPFVVAVSTLAYCARNISGERHAATVSFTSGWRGPDFAEENRLAVPPAADRLIHDVHIHRAGQGVRHHQRRAGQIIGFHEWIDAALEIAIARKHRRRPPDRGFSTALAIACGSGPLLPMQVVQP